MEILIVSLIFIALAFSYLVNKESVQIENIVGEIQDIKIIEPFFYRDRMQTSLGYVSVSRIYPRTAKLQVLTSAGLQKFEIPTRKSLSLGETVNIEKVISQSLLEERVNYLLK